MQELAVDLGTANTLIMQDDKVVVDEPSIVAINKKTGEIIAVGNKDMQMHEKTHKNIDTIRPLKDGVIADFQAAESMIQGMINMIGNKRRFFTHLRMVICIPSGITEVEIDTSIKNLKVLVVEDVALNQLLMKIILDDFGFERDIENNGKEAIEKLQSKSFDIV